MLILSGQTSNAIFRNSDEAQVLCSALPFQQIPMEVYTSNRSRVTTGFVKTVVGTPPKKKRKKWTKTQIYSLTSPSFSKAIHLTFSFSKYHPSAAKHAFILSTNFFTVVSNSFFGIALRSSRFPGSKFWPHSSHFNHGNNQNLESLIQLGFKPIPECATLDSRVSD